MTMVILVLGLVAWFIVAWWLGRRMTGPEVRVTWVTARNRHRGIPVSRRVVEEGCHE